MEKEQIGLGAIFFWAGEGGLCHHILNLPGVAGAVLQTSLSLTDRVIDPFPPNIHNTRNPTTLTLRT